MNKTWKISILTIFPEMFPGPLNHSIAGKALKDNKLELDIFDIRNYAFDKHKTVDDKIFGGGTGMLMRPDVIGNALDAAIIKNKPKKLVYFTPRGKKFDQNSAHELISDSSILMLCGRYEGIDQRIFQEYDFIEYSIGDYILSGGEIAALVALDTCIRILPGILHKNQATARESFALGEYQNLLEYDQYTRPAEWRGKKVPEILLSGNHQKIEEWCLNNAKEITQNRRPELLKNNRHK